MEWFRKPFPVPINSSLTSATSAAQSHLSKAKASSTISCDRITSEKLQSAKRSGKSLSRLFSFGKIAHRQSGVRHNWENLPGFKSGFRSHHPEFSLENLSWRPASCNRSFNASNCPARKPSRSNRMRASSVRSSRIGGRGEISSGVLKIGERYVWIPSFLFKESLVPANLPQDGIPLLFASGHPEAGKRRSEDRYRNRASSSVVLWIRRWPPKPTELHNEPRTLALKESAKSSNPSCQFLAAV